MYGTMYGMAVKTTVYLPDALKAALEAEAAGLAGVDLVR